jgi:hypothetical protein
MSNLATMSDGEEQSTCLILLPPFEPDIESSEPVETSIPATTESGSKKGSDWARPQVPRIHSVASDCKLLQFWEGRVESVSADSLVATVYDRTTPSNPPEEMEFDLEEFQLADQPLVEPGAVFYWSIGYRNYRRGNRHRYSEIRFRRLIQPEDPKLQEKAASLAKLLAADA